jgi:hypothetical protein
MSAPVITQHEVPVVVRAWRSGAVHLEVWIVSFEDADGEIRTHLQDAPGAPRFETACGKPWFGVLSASGCHDAHTITCEACREILLNARLTVWEAS